MNNNDDFNDVLKKLDSLIGDDDGLILDSTSKTRELFGAEEPKMAGVYYQSDIGDNTVQTSKSVSNYDNTNQYSSQRDSMDPNQIQKNTVMENFTQNSYGVPSIRDDTNTATRMVRDDYYNNRPAPGNFYEINKEKILFNGEHITEEEYIKKCGNVSMKNVVNDNSIRHTPNTSNQQHFLHQNQYINTPLLFPNIANNPLTEYIKEHSLIIDSIDRNYTVYPNSLAFRVKFNGMGAETRVRRIVNNNQYETTTYTVPETTRPYFLDDLENVRYLRLDKLMIPDCYKITSGTEAAAGLTSTDIATDGSKTVGIVYDSIYRVTHYYGTTEYSFFNINNGCHFYRDGSTYYYSDPTYKISDDRFTQIEIEEISGTNNYSTNNLTTKTFGVLYLDKKYFNNGFVYVHTTYSNILYKFSDLKNFHSLTFKFYDSLGNQLDASTNQVDGTDTNKPLAAATDPRTSDYHPDHYLLHPLFKFRQIHMVFKVGILETELNKKNYV